MYWSPEDRVNAGIKLRKLALGVGGAGVLLLFCACAVKKPPSTTQAVKDSLPPTTSIPEQWTSTGVNPAPVETGCLKSFNDPQMEAVVAEALKNNLDLQAAATRVPVAANVVTEVHAQMMPIVSVVGEAKYLGRFRQKNAGGQTRGNFNASSLLGGASWERDIWAKIRSQTAAAKQGLAPPQASVFLPEANIFLLWRLEWKRFRALLGHTAFTAPCDVSALLGDTPVRPQTPRRYQLGARILPPGLETGSANPLPAEPNPPANRVFLFSQTSDARRPGSPLFIQAS
jgi:hypothetical protein